MTPMTGSISNAQKDWPVLISCLLQRFLTPGVPGHWIVGMLEQIGAGLVFEFVRHTIFPMVAIRIALILGMAQP
jgi:hypothetical protein